MEISELILTVVTIQMPCFNSLGFCLSWFNEFIVLTQNFTVLLTFVSELRFCFLFLCAYCHTIDGECYV